MLSSAITGTISCSWFIICICQLKVGKPRVAFVEVKPPLDEGDQEGVNVQ